MRDLADAVVEARRFDAEFQAEFAELIAWRRDVRRFRSGAVPEATLDELFRLAALAPSVGNCQPARFVRIDDETRREAVRANFEAANRQALGAYHGERAQLYASLKLAGLSEAPVQLAVFCDDATEQGHGLGARTMPETRRYSTVCALHTFWLGARAHGLGVGWVSILDPRALAETLDVPRDWSLHCLSLRRLAGGRRSNTRTRTRRLAGADGASGVEAVERRPGRCSRGR